MGLGPRERVHGLAELPRPDSRYAVGKLFGEAAVSLYCDKHRLQALSIRIGNAADRPQGRRRLGIWISWRDLAQLVELGLHLPDLGHEVVYGISDTHRIFFDNRRACDLGFRPQDDPQAHRASVFAEDPPPAPGSAAHASVAERSIGGDWAASEHEGSGLPGRERPASPS